VISFSRSEARFAMIVGAVEAVLLAISQAIEWQDRGLGAVIVAIVIMPAASVLVLIGALIAVAIVRRRGGQLRLEVAIGCSIGVPVAAAIANACSLSMIRPSVC
jgi:hypothetical protein